MCMISNSIIVYSNDIILKGLHHTLFSFPIKAAKGFGSSSPEDCEPPAFSWLICAAQPRAVGVVDGRPPLKGSIERNIGSPVSRVSPCLFEVEAVTVMGADTGAAAAAADAIEAFELRRVLAAVAAVPAACG